MEFVGNSFNKRWFADPIITYNESYRLVKIDMFSIAYSFSIIWKSLFSISGNIFDSFESQNPTYQNMMFNYGQNLASFSHGEAFLHIITQRVKRQGIYIFDEPESAFRPYTNYHSSTSYANISRKSVHSLSSPPILQS